MQLVAYGAQDVYLSGNPQITFFKVVYRRHTNFSVEPIQQVWNGAADFGRTVTCNINRNGDLITSMYVSVLLNQVSAGSVPWGYVNRLGHAMINECKVEIGGSKIDEQYGDYMQYYTDLYFSDSNRKSMIGLDDVCNKPNLKIDSETIYIPLKFWFCKILVD